MNELPAKVLRAGVVTGLCLTVAGIIIYKVLGVAGAQTVGLWIVVLTPISALITVGAGLARRRDYLGVLAVAVMIAAIVISVITSLHR